MNMYQCILDHYSFRVMDSVGDTHQINSLISLFGLFPNFIKDGYNLTSNYSKYIEYLDSPLAFYDYIYGEIYQTVINGKVEGIQFVDASPYIGFSHYRNGKLEGLSELQRTNGNIIEKGQYVDGLRDGTWQILKGSPKGPKLSDVKYGKGIKL